MPSKMHPAKNHTIGDFILAKLESGVKTSIDAFSQHAEQQISRQVDALFGKVSHGHGEGLQDEKDHPEPRAAGNFRFAPPRDLGCWQKLEPGLLNRSTRTSNPSAEDLRGYHQNQMAILKKYRENGIEMAPASIEPLLTVTRYCFTPAYGVKRDKVLRYENDLKSVLKVESVMIHPTVPGEEYIGVDVPNPRPPMVTTGDLLASAEWNAEKTRMRIPLALGKDLKGKTLIRDLAAMPHLLIAGATGKGKSVCINNLIASLLCQFSPRQLRLVMIDPKQVELARYNQLQQTYLTCPVMASPQDAIDALHGVKDEMQRRYELLNARGARDIEEYNQAARQRGTVTLPYIVVIIDELSSLMSSAPKEAEKAIVTITQLARAAGIHCILATQRPTCDTITGNIKANVTSQIAFKVRDNNNSRVILDEGGAEYLRGDGDMLVKDDATPDLVRAQGGLITTAEVNQMVDHVAGIDPKGHNGLPVAQDQPLQAVVQPPLYAAQ